MSLPPHAPWRLQGDCIVGLARRPVRLGPLPPGLRPLPGPAVIAAVRYVDSPVGPYAELAVGEPARLGLRPGLCITTMVVTSSDAKVGGAVNWGFPKEIGTLEWSPTADNGIQLWWKERDITVRAAPIGKRSFPGAAFVRLVQHRSDGLVVVPARGWGWTRLSRLTVDVGDEDDPLAPVRGTHPGVQVSGLRFAVDPARHPIGFASTLRAPLRAPEPALSAPRRGDGVHTPLPVLLRSPTASGV